MDDSTRPAVLDAIRDEFAALLGWLGEAEGLSLAEAEGAVRAGVLAAGARLLEAGLAARRTGKAGPRAPCPCGGAAGFEGYRPKRVQTLVGWVGVRRAWSACPGCGRGHAPLDAALGLGRDSHGPGVRRLAARFGALLPFAQAADALREAAAVWLSAIEVRGVTEAVGARREEALVAAADRAWAAGLPPAPAPPPDRLYVALDGVRILDTTGAGREAKVGVVVPVRRGAAGEERAPASYAVGFAEASAFGRRLALEAHRRGAEGARDVAVLGDGAAWIWNLAEEHFPAATQIADWFHAGERVWALGRALFGDGTPEAEAWVRPRLDRLLRGEVRALVDEWRALACRGEAAAARDEQVTYFANQAARMADDRYRAAGLDIGSGMVESACKYVVGASEKGPGMRRAVAGAQAVANVRVLLCNGEWAAHPLAA